MACKCSVPHILAYGTSTDIIGYRYFALEPVRLIWFILLLYMFVPLIIIFERAKRVQEPYCMWDLHA